MRVVPFGFRLNYFEALKFVENISISLLSFSSTFDWISLNGSLRLVLLKMHKITLQWFILTTYRCHHYFSTFYDNCNNKRILPSGENVANFRETEENREGKTASEIQMNSTHLIQMKQNQTTKLLKCNAETLPIIKYDFKETTAKERIKFEASLMLWIIVKYSLNLWGVFQIWFACFFFLFASLISWKWNTFDYV